MTCLSRSLLTLLVFACGAAGLRGGGDIVVLPDYKVSAAVMAAMIPRDQLRDICDEANAFHGSFELSTVTFIKAPTSQFPADPRCFVRARDGHVLEDITNPVLQFAVDQHWTDGFLSSNQPEQYAAFYLMLRPHLGGGPVTLGAAEKLLRDYTTFAERRLNAAIRHYGAQGAWCIDLRWASVPDELDFVATSPGAAAAIAGRLAVEPQGTVVRVSADALAAALAKRGTDFPVAQPSEIDVVSPWRFTTGLPAVKDHAVLIRVAWVQYRQGTQAPRTDFVGLLLDPAPPGA